MTSTGRSSIPPGASVREWLRRFPRRWPLLFESPRTEARILVGPSVLDNPETADYLGHRPEATRLPVSELARARDILGVICLGNPDLVQRLAVLTRAVADVIVQGSIAR